MNELYVIAWRSPDGKTGQGKQQYSLEECKGRCARLFRAWGGIIEYWPQLVESLPTTVKTEATK